MDATRIYAQLKPDAAGIASLTALQSMLDEAHALRLVPASRIHLTVLHFGIAGDVFRSINRVTNVDEVTFGAALATYIHDSEALMRPATFELMPIGFARLGHPSTTLVVEYQASQELISLHASLLTCLYRFFAACGLDEPDAYMAGSRNFVHARTIRPHITLGRGFDGRLPEAPLTPVVLSPMPTVYNT